MYLPENFSFCNPNKMSCMPRFSLFKRSLISFSYSKPSFKLKSLRVKNNSSHIAVSMTEPEQYCYAHHLNSVFIFLLSIYFPKKARSIIPVDSADCWD